MSRTQEFDPTMASDRYRDARARGQSAVEFAERGGLRTMSIMHIFRMAARQRDSRDPARHYSEGDLDLTIRSQQRRDGASDTALRQNLMVDITSLMNTIRLDVVIDLSGADYVRDSVVNYGFQNLDSIWRMNATTTQVADSIRTALIRNEPRLRPASIEVRVTDGGATPDHRLTFEISAEMIASPTDIPMEFLAEVDPSAGRIHVKRGGAG